MDEKASIRLTLRCASAPRFPTIMVTTASTAIAGRKRKSSEGSPCASTRMKAPSAAAFTPAAMNAVTGVGAPS